MNQSEEGLRRSSCDAGFLIVPAAAFVSWRDKVLSISAADESAA